MPRFTYNAPFTLTFAIASTMIMLSDQYYHTDLVPTYFTANQASPNFVTLFKLFSHVLGHMDWDHLFGNLSMLLVLGPSLEEKYGTVPIALMSALTAVLTALISLIGFRSGILGASGMVLLFVVLATFPKGKSGEMPLSTVLVVLLYFTKEYVTTTPGDGVAHFAHYVGGFLGFIYGIRKNAKGLGR